jgi:hypothetical protein
LEGVRVAIVVRGRGAASWEDEYGDGEMVATVARQEVSKERRAVQLEPALVS